MYIEIENKIIKEPVINILRKAQLQLNNGKLSSIKNPNKSNILISCPNHKNGLEKNPSCQIFNRTDDKKLEAGFAHCFSCGFGGPLFKVIGKLFDEDDEFGKEWLLDNFQSSFLEDIDYLPEIILDPIKPVEEEKSFLDASILTKYNYYHPYMWKRKLTKDVVDKFEVGYDNVRDAITFPVYDENKNLVMVTARSTQNKKFYIPEDVEKPVYLLFDILENKNNSVFVVESQINALTLRTWGYPSIALFGTGSYKQLEKLKNSGIRNYYLCFDGDEAGQKGAKRFKDYLKNNAFITELKMPSGRDINDLDKNEFEEILKSS